MVDGTGIIGVDMVCPLGVSTPQPPNYDRVEMEGTGMLVLPNSLDAPLERLELGGKTEQVQTTGAQLFEASRYEGVTKNGVTVTVKDGVITATGTPNINTWIQVFVSRENYQKLFKPENKIYLKTNKSKDCNYDFGIYGAFGSPIIGTIREGNSGRVLPAELPRNDTDFYFFIDVKIGAELKGSIKPIVYHDGDGTWEPYTGGKPSPSQEYQQKIKNVGKWNEGTQKYEVDVKVSNCGYLQKGSYADKIRPLPLEKGKTYRIYVDVKSAVVNVCILNEERTFANSGQLYAYYNSRGYPISSTGVVSGICRLPNSLYRGYTFTVTVDGLFLYQGVNANILNTDNAYVAYDFIKKVDISSPYTEKESVVLTSDRPITKWDKLVEQDGQIGWLYQSAIDTDIRPSRTDLFPYGFKLYKNHSNGVYTYTVTNIKKIKGYQTSYCKQFKNVDGSYNTGELYRYSDQPSMQSQYFNTDIATKEEFIKWMENNPLTMVYKTEETEFVPLPQSEQNAIRALKTYYPTTVITVDGGELDPDIKVTYRKEI
jgi:hypothetical protein